MAPQDFRDARKNETSKNGEDFHVKVDNRPYYPNLNVDIDDEKSICVVASKVLSLDLSPSWKVTKVTGGITNSLFRVSNLSNDNPSIDFDSVLLRVFGTYIQS